MEGTLAGVKGHRVGTEVSQEPHSVELEAAQAGEGRPQLGLGLGQVAPEKGADGGQESLGCFKSRQPKGPRAWHTGDAGMDLG